MRLAELQAAFGGQIEGDAERTVSGVSLNSSTLEPGEVFAALPGTQIHGMRFAADAVDRGAAAVLMPHEHDGRAASLQPAVPEGTSIWRHPQARRTAGQVAARLAGEPSRELTVCGITGTNGKTTTAHILGQLLDGAGLAPAVLGTAGNRIAGEELAPASHTTPDAPALQRLLAKHVAQGGRSVAAEVSSHALMQERHAGLDLDVAVFTNLSPEHLDYHGSMEGYAAAKARLFHALHPGSHAVVHLDDPAAEIMTAAARGAGARVWTYSARQDADLSATSLRTDPHGMRFVIEGMGICSCDLLLPLRGRFNVENALAAALAARLMGAGPNVVSEGLASTFSIPGRLEPVPNDRGFSVLVDYAHSADALGRVLVELRAGLEDSGSGRLICVFGCGGDRDPSKRGPMGAVAAAHSDVVIVTNDNPRGEAPEAIAAAVLEGARAQDSGRPCEVLAELDRRKAIASALGCARPGDVVLLAGKGHETGQRVGDTLVPFDDRRVAQEVLTLSLIHI